MGELETAIEALNDRPIVFDRDEVARAGAFVSIAADGSLRIERGYVRQEDELPVEPEAETMSKPVKTRHQPSRMTSSAGVRPMPPRPLPPNRRRTRAFARSPIAAGRN